MLLEKCLRAESKTRPRTAIELRNEAVLVDFLERLENVIETRSNELMQEVGFDPDGVH